MRRNRSHLKRTIEENKDEVKKTLQRETQPGEDKESKELKSRKSRQFEKRQPQQIVDCQGKQKVEIRTRSGRLLNKPAYLKDYVSFTF